MHSKNENAVKMPEGKRAGIEPSAVVIAVTGIILINILPLLPKELFWGIKSFEAPVFFRTAMIVLLFLSAINRVQDAVLNGISRLSAFLERHVSGKLLTIMFFAGLFILLWIFRERKLWGDALKLLTSLEAGPSSNAFWGHFWKKPLDRLIHMGAYRAGSYFFGWSSSVTVPLVNCLAGSATIIILYRLVRRIFPDDGIRITAMGLLLFNGSSLVYFGHFEQYTMIQTGTALFFLTAVNYLKGRGSLITASIAAATAAALHAEGVLLFFILPLLFYLRKGKKPEERSSPYKALIKIILPYAGFLILFYLGCRLIGSPEFTAGFNRLDIDRHVFLSPAAAFSPRHLSDFFNILFRNIPLWPFYFITLLLMWKTARRRKHSEALLFNATSLIYFTALLFFDSKLPPHMDWDIYAIITLPAVLAGTRALSLLGRSIKRPLFVLAVISFCLTAPWILSNRFHPDESSKRIQIETKIMNAKPVKR